MIGLLVGCAGDDPHKIEACPDRITSMFTNSPPPVRCQVGCLGKTEFGGDCVIMGRNGTQTICGQSVGEFEGTHGCCEYGQDSQDWAISFVECSYYAAPADAGP